MSNTIQNKTVNLDGVPQEAQIVPAPDQNAPKQTQPVQQQLQQQQQMGLYGLLGSMADAQKDNQQLADTYRAIANELTKADSRIEAENAWQQSQVDRARAQKEANFQKAKAEYEGTAPEKGFTDRLWKAVAGVPVYNPETGQYERRNPRNGGEAAWQAFDIIPELGHAILTGNANLTREHQNYYRNKTMGPFADLNAAGQIGYSPKYQPTIAERLSTRLGGSVLAEPLDLHRSELEAQQEIKNIGLKADALRNAGYDEATINRYVKSQLGILNDAADQLSLTANNFSAIVDEELTKGTIDDQTLATRLAQGQDILLKAKPGSAEYSIAQNTIKRLRDEMNARATVSGAQSPNTAFKRDINRVGTRIVEDGGVTDEELNEFYKQPGVKEVLDKIAENYVSKLRARGKNEAEQYLQDALENSSVVQSLGINIDDWWSRLLQGAGGALGGAAIGAGAGALGVPLVGAVPGAIVGGAAGLFAPEAIDTVADWFDIDTRGKNLLTPDDANRYKRRQILVDALKNRIKSKAMGGDVMPVNILDTPPDPTTPEITVEGQLIEDEEEARKEAIDHALMMLYNDSMSGTNTGFIA